MPEASSKILKKKISERILVGEISLPSSPHLRHNPNQLLSLLKPFLRRGRRKAVSQHFSNVGMPVNQRQAYWKLTLGPALTFFVFFTSSQGNCVAQLNFKMNSSHLQDSTQLSSTFHSYSFGWKVSHYTWPKEGKMMVEKGTFWTILYLDWWQLKNQRQSQLKS